MIENGVMMVSTRGARAALMTGLGCFLLAFAITFALAWMVIDALPGGGP